MRETVKRMHLLDLNGLCFDFDNVTGAQILEGRRVGEKGKRRVCMFLPSEDQPTTLFPL